LPRQKGEYKDFVYLCVESLKGIHAQWPHYHC